MGTIGAVWRVIGPGGEVVARAEIEDWRTADKRPPAEIVEAAGTPGRGYHVCWSPIPPPRKQWSREARARGRVRRLRERTIRRLLERGAQRGWWEAPGPGQVAEWRLSRREIREDALRMWREVMGDAPVPDYWAGREYVVERAL